MPHDLDTGALLAAAKEQGQWLTSGGSESRARYVLGDKLGGLWPQALRALVAQEEVERHTLFTCEDCWHGVCERRVKQVADADGLRAAILLAAQERLLPGRAEGEEG